MSQHCSVALTSLVHIATSWMGHSGLPARETGTQLLSRHFADNVVADRTFRFLKEKAKSFASKINAEICVWDFLKSPW